MILIINDFNIYCCSLQLFFTVTNQHKLVIFKTNNRVIRTAHTVIWSTGSSFCWIPSAGRALPVSHRYSYDKGFTGGPKWYFGGKWLLLVTLSPLLCRKSISTHFAKDPSGRTSASDADATFDDYYCLTPKGISWF